MANATTPVIQINEGNVGIGTASPDNKLEVQGVISSADSGLQKATFANVGNDLVLTANADATNVTAKMLFKSSGAGGGAVSEKMSIQGDGSVIIGSSAVGGNKRLLMLSADNAVNYDIDFQQNGTTNHGRIRYTEGASDLLFYPITGVSPNLTLKFNGDSYFQRGNVGIGHTTLYQKFTVNGNIDIRGGNGSYLTFNNGDANIKIHDNNVTVQGRDLGFETWKAGVGLTEKMRITREGNVGIGTTNPDANLEVVGTTVTSTASDGVNAVLIGLAGSNRTTIQFDTADTTHTNRQWGLTNIAGDFYIGRHGLNVMTMKNNGNVGIGTTLPSEKLTLQLDTQNQAFSGKNGTDYLWFLRNEAGAGARQSGRFQLMDTDVTTVNIESASNRNTYFNAGNVGIATTSPIHPLYVAGDIGQTDGSRIWFRGSSSSSTTGAQSYVYSNGLNLQIKGDDNVQLLGDGGGVIAHFDYTGKVGIGTTTPLAPLHIVTPAVAGIDLTNISRTANNLVRFTNPQYSTSATMGLLLRVFPDSDSRQGAGLLMTGGSDNAASNLSLFVSKDDGTSSNVSKSYSALHIAGNTGNVGIGTTSPLGKLMVREDSAGNPTKLIVSNGGTVQAGTTARLSFYEGTSEKGYIERRRDGTGKMAFYTPADDNPFVWENPSGEIMRITNSKVGIGRTSPQQKLDTPNIIIGGSSIAASYRANATLMDNLGGVARFYSLGADNSTGGSYQFNSLSANASAGSGTVMTILNSGNVGIGATGPTGKLEIQRSQVAGQFDRDCFLRLHPSATTNSGGLTNIMFGTSTVNNYGVAVGGKRAGTGDTSSDNNPEFSVRILNDATVGIEVLNINTTGAIKFNAYNSTNNTGSPTHILGTDANGLVVKSTAGSSIGPWLPLAAGSGERVTGDLYISENLYMRPSATYGNGYKAMTVTGTNSAPYTSTISFSNYAQSNVMVIKGGNVGIGTTNPTFQLSIENHATTSSIATMEIDGKRTNGTDGPVGEMIFSNNGDTFATVAGYRDTADNKGSLQFQTQDSTFATRMTISSEGNVGIGTSSPTSAAGVARFLEIEGSTAGIVLHDDGNDPYEIWASGGNLVFRYNNTASENGMLLSASGNLGIGTTAPSAKLDVREDANNVYTAYFYNSDTAANSNGINVQTATTNTNAYAFRVNSGSNSNALVVKGDANVGIGTSTPGATLHVTKNNDGGSAKIILENSFPVASGSIDETTRIESRFGAGYAASYITTGKEGDYTTGALGKSYLSFSTRTATTSMSEKMRINSVGNVGIGDASPTSISANTFSLSVNSSRNDLSGALISKANGTVKHQQYWDSSGYSFNLSAGAFQFNGGNVGIGTTTPDLTGFGWNVLTVMGGTGTGNAGVLELAAPSADSNDENLGIISFNNASVRNAQIAANRESATNNAYLTFWTSPGSGIAERMRIDSAGAIKFNTYTMTQQTGTSAYLLGVDASGNVVQSTNIPSGTGGPFLPVAGPTFTGTLTGPTASFSQGLKVIGPGSYNTFRSGNDYTLGFLDSAGTTQWWIKAYTNGDFALHENGAGDQFTIEAGGNVGIGDTSPSNKLDVNGDIRGTAYKLRGNLANPTSTAVTIYDQASVGLTLSAHNTSFRSYDGSNMIESARLVHDKLTVVGDVIAYGTPSDKRLKENVKPIESALDKAMKLQGVTFDWKKSDSILNIKEDIGFIAQDVKKVLPELVRENKDGMLSMRHQGIAPILLEAIKELKAEIDLLKSKPCTCNNCNCNI